MLVETRLSQTIERQNAKANTGSFTTMETNIVQTNGQNSDDLENDFPCRLCFLESMSFGDFRDVVKNGFSKLDSIQTRDEWINCSKPSKHPKESEFDLEEFLPALKIDAHRTYYATDFTTLSTKAPPRVFGSVTRSSPPNAWSQQNIDEHCKFPLTTWRSTSADFTNLTEIHRWYTDEFYFFWRVAPPSLLSKELDNKPIKFYHWLDENFKAHWDIDKNFEWGINFDVLPKKWSLKYSKVCNQKDSKSKIRYHVSILLQNQRFFKGIFEKYIDTQNIERWRVKSERYYLHVDLTGLSQLLTNGVGAMILDLDRDNPNTDWQRENITEIERCQAAILLDYLGL